MSIYHKTSSSTVGNVNTAEIDYHTSEAAKVKRTREQAYFNSYDFDAIEVLPYDDDEDDDDDDHNKHDIEHKLRARKELPLTVQQPEATKSSRHNFSHLQNNQPTQQPLSHCFSAGSTSSDSFIVDTHHHYVSHSNIISKYNPSVYLQRITGIFHHKTGNNHKHDSKAVTAATVTATDNDDVIEHTTKRLKIPSSKTSTSTSLSSDSVVAEGILSGNSTANRVRDRDRDIPYDYVVEDVATTTGTRVVSNADKIAINTTVVNNSEEGAKAANTNVVGNVNDGGSSGGNFSLPRAMLKYQSSTLMQQGAAASNVNSMPSAANINNNHSNTSIKQINTSLAAAPTISNTDSLNVVKGNSNMASISDGDAVGIDTPLRLKKTSITSSSITTSLNSVDLEEQQHVANKIKEQSKASPKTSINHKSSARASSHQSHYSTDKSASSGYYSSNVCSTCSLEEHIYSEPNVDLNKLHHQQPKENNNKTTLPLSTSSAATPQTRTLNQQQQQQQQQLQTSLLVPTTSIGANSVMRTLEYTRRYGFADNDLPNTQTSQTLPSKQSSQKLNDNLKILETSIENLDRHLKSFPVPNSQEGVVNYATNPYSSYTVVNANDKQRQLPTIQEAFDSLKKTTWTEDRSDDSLMDIDLDSFLLDKEKKSEKTNGNLNSKGLVNPSFLTEEQEENNYKCAKYINSCPEDAYRVESDILAPTRSSISGQSAAISVDLYPKRYEEQLHFENTRELLEDVRDKIRLLTQTQEAGQNLVKSNEKEEHMPQELNAMINTLKKELELYLDRMNQHSELEIRQLCTGLVKNQQIVKMKNAFERRRSLTDSNDICSTYEAIQDGIVVNARGVPINIRQQITSIRCTSDPNFKMKRKSITEVFPMAECYVESIQTDSKYLTPNSNNTKETHPTPASQLQKNLSFHKPVLEQLSSITNASVSLKASGSLTNADNSETNDKESMLEWHRKKPSIWEMYYGTNRIQQSLLGVKKNGMMLTTACGSSPSPMCYPSSRPESDFTLDVPRAEQLRIKMEKEKKFRQRCRIITTFLSLVFFLLTVMVVSLVLTRGKRMFGSMI